MILHITRHITSATCANIGVYIDWLRVYLLNRSEDQGVIPGMVFIEWEVLNQNPIRLMHCMR